MQNEKYYKGLFFVGAIWNWIISVALFFGREPMLKFLGMKPPVYIVPFQMAMVLVFVFGIAYFYVYKDLIGNKVCAKIGVYSKVAIFFVLSYYWITGEILFVMVIPGIVDVIFAILFLEFLFRVKREKKYK